MAVAADEAREKLMSLIRKVNEDCEAVEIVSAHGNAVLLPAEECAALREGAYLLRSPANARRLFEAYGNAMRGEDVSRHGLVDPG
ncbi:type II toxin-antitoxin system prevent-host-death family antitoxin [Streptomyces sp. LP05-1]|uniref:Antitoxin n=1 Tax=Streptomyces pyxinae TaxID=2970734 RepID=A0ABT2CJY9_9ACTN|nr:type II toxin-antitoxin system prevent-host-death family antitoxin [Streptomyces sp. LP05-1]MCS0637717.1 type II toxin-antitoxin system prevent-host-death family antitoxin [Streptomyces sp. LP05-1]